MTPTTADKSSAYRGRFAPSPSGPLHQGSLLTALASYLDARHACGEWLLRIEDIDPPREPPGAAQAILDCLDAHGLQATEVLYQSSRSRAYDQALDTLMSQGRLFHCACTRRELGPGGACGGRCASANARSGLATSLRVRVTEEFPRYFTDLIQGEQSVPAEDIPRDFVVRRKDGFYAYQLAVVVDEAHQGISHVIRGIDLLPTTFQQRYLQQLLDLPQPAYGHVPVVVGRDGRKLSKQNRAPAVNNRRPLENLREMLALLGQDTPEAGTREELLYRAAASWNRAALYGSRQLYPPGTIA